MTVVAFLAAVQFLTVAPVRLPAPPDDTQLGRSLLFYPLIGALIGAAVALIGALCQGLPPPVTAALLLAALCLASGGLHLDGLADSCDALAARGDRERALAVMRDPRCGALGAVAVGVVLIAKFAALAALVAAGPAALAAALIAACAAARACVIALYATTDYVRIGGLGIALAANLPRAAGRAVLAATALGVGIACAAGGLGLGAGALMLIAAAIAFVVCRRLMLARIGGATGDTTGATVEAVETAMLLAAAAAL